MNKAIGTKETMEIKKSKDSTSKKKHSSGGVKRKEDQETKKEEDVVITVRMRWTNAMSLWVCELWVESWEWWVGHVSRVTVTHRKVHTHVVVPGGVVGSLYQRVLDRLWSMKQDIFLLCIKSWICWFYTCVPIYCTAITCYWNKNKPVQNEDSITFQHRWSPIWKVS